MDNLSQEPSRAENPRTPERPGSWAFQLALCLLGPLLFLSIGLTFLAPIPFLYLHLGTPNLKRGRLWLGFAVALGLVLCFLIHGWIYGSLLFFLLAPLPAIVLGEMLLRHSKLESTVLSAAFAVFMVGALSAELIMMSKGLPLFSTLKQTTETFVLTNLETFLATQKANISSSELEAIQLYQKNPSLIFDDLPGVAAAFLLLLCIIPCIALIRWNPKGLLRRIGLPRDLLRRWASPTWLMYLSLLGWATLFFDLPYLSITARNLVKPLLVIYFLQGMSILAYFLDWLRLRGILRVLAYFLALTPFVLPIVASFGFIDYWFDFRGLNRSPPEEPKERGSSI